MSVEALDKPELDRINYDAHFSGVAAGNTPIDEHSTALCRKPTAATSPILTLEAWPMPK